MMNSLCSFAKIKPCLPILGALLLMLTAAPSSSRGYSSGPPDGVAGDPPQYNNCTMCHNSFPVNSGDGLLQLLGLPQAYQPDSTYLLVIALVDTGQSRWGFELTSILNDGSQGGILAPGSTMLEQLSEGPGTQRDYLKHTTLGTLQGLPAAAWGIEWTAPSVGSDSVHFYLAGNAANGNGNNQGDYIYTISVHLPEGVLGVEETPARQPVTPLLVSTYPNPFNPTTVINFQLPAAGDVALAVFDVNGRPVETKYFVSLPAGSYEVFFDGSNLSSGIYAFRLEAAKFGAGPEGRAYACGKMVLMK